MNSTLLLQPHYFLLIACPAHRGVIHRNWTLSALLPLLLLLLLLLMHTILTLAPISPMVAQNTPCRCTQMGHCVVPSYEGGRYTCT
jgi:hypothetical protein